MMERRFILLKIKKEGSGHFVHNTHIVGCERVFFLERKVNMLDHLPNRTRLHLREVSNVSHMHALSISMCIKEKKRKQDIP